MSTTDAMRPYLDRIQSRALICGIIGVVATAAGVFLDSDQFFRSYLFGFMFWFGLAVGSIGVLMLHHMVGGNWGVAIRRGLEAGSRTLPLMILLFIPLTFGLHQLYEWAHPDLVAKDAVLTHKSGYLNPLWFYIRAVIYFAVWIYLMVRLNSMSARQEREGYWAVRPALQRLSAPGLIAHVLVMTFASVDWLMSIESHYFSTIYGAIVVISQVLTTFAFMVVLMRNLTNQDPMKDLVKSHTFHDLGNLMLAFTMFWAYVAFSQFIIIWSGNLPEEITWYLRRINGEWTPVALIVVLFAFAVPFFLLLMRPYKRNPQILARIALLIILMRLVDTFWFIEPAYAHADANAASIPFHIHWLDLAAPIGIGGLWVWFFIYQLKRRSLDPLPLT